MERKTELTKGVIAESFKTLVCEMPFNKITIKKICDGAGLIRPTFYHHFCDKLDLLDWVIRQELTDALCKLVHERRYEEAHRYAFLRTRENRAFYHKAFQIEGQNGITDIFARLFWELLEKEHATFCIQLPEKQKKAMRKLQSEVLAHTFVSAMRSWLESEDSVEMAVEAANYYITHSIVDLLENGMESKQHTQNKENDR